MFAKMHEFLLNREDVQINLDQVKLDIRHGIRECSDRRLTKTTKWLAELNYALREHEIIEEDPLDPYSDGILLEDRDIYALAKSYFDCQEYDRAAHILEHCLSPKCVFLLRYSQYMSSEKKRLDNAVEPGNEDSESKQILLELLSYFKANQDSLDGYLLYLEGIVYKKLNLKTEAVPAFQLAVAAVPTLWAAWLELAGLTTEFDELETMRLPDHWMLHFFVGHVLVDQKLSEQALESYAHLMAVGFEKSTYITAQMAIAHHDRRDVDSSLELFKEIGRTDPYRVDNWDVYSHLLYLKENRVDLANLAQRAVSIDKYRVETCCVIGNYYSLRSEHKKAVVQFQRALKLDPSYFSAWILMGHEFIELRNANAAIQCYRKALEVNESDYRAWNGLGHAYEILGLNRYCIYYYSRAATLKPDDSRMLMSLGEAYDKMDEMHNAIKCYHKAHGLGDIEGMALFKLGKLYEKVRMPNSAAAAYTSALLDASTTGSREVPMALRFLAQYYLRVSLLDQSSHYASLCLEYDAAKEYGKSILKMISKKRLADSKSEPMDIPKLEVLVDSDNEVLPRAAEWYTFEPVAHSSHQKPNIAPDPFLPIPSCSNYNKRSKM